MAAFAPVGVEATVKGLAGFTRDLGKMDKSIDNLGKNTSGLGSKFKSLGTTVLGFGAAAAKAAAGGVAALGAGMIALGVSSVRTAADFEAQIAILSTAVDDAAISMDTLQEAALAVGADTDLVGVSASQAAEAMTGLYKAGLTTTDIFGDLNSYLEGTGELSGALRAAVDLQAASELDLAAASDLVAVTMATFGLSAEEATRISNNFVQAADASVANVADLGEALKNVGPTAAAFGFSLEDTNNALAILSTRGISGAEAGTALKSMLTNIMRPTDDVTEALKALNVSLYDADGNMRPLPDIIAQLSEALQVGSERTITQAVVTEEMMKAAERAAEKMTDLERALVVAEANAGMNADTMREMVAQYIEANGTIEGFGALLGDKANYELFRSVTAFDEAKAAIDAFEQAQGKTITSVQTLTEEQRNQYVQTLAGTYGMKALQTLLDEGVVGWDAMAEATGAASTAQAIAQARTATFKGAMEALGGVIETLKIRIGNALLPILTELAKSFADYINQYGPMLTAVFENLAQWLATNIPVAIQTLSNFWTGTLLPAIQQVWDFFSTNILPLFQVYLPQAIQFVMDHWEEFRAALIAIGGFIAVVTTVTAIGAAIAALTNPITLIVAAVGLLGAAWQSNFLGIRDTLTEFWQNTAQPALAQLYEWLKIYVPIAIQALAEFWTGTLQPALETVWGFITESVIPALSDVWTWLSVNVPIALQTLADFWETTLLPALTTVWGFITESVIPALSQVWTWLSVNVPIALQTLSDFWQNILLPALNIVWAFINESVIPVLSQIWTWLSTNIPAAIQTASDFWKTTLLPAITEIYDFINTYLVPLFQAIDELLRVTLVLAIETIANAWQNVLIPAFDAFWKFINEKILPVFSQIQEAIQPIVDFIGQLIDKFNQLIGIDLSNIGPDIDLAEGWEGAKNVLGDLTEKTEGWTEKLRNIQPPVFLKTDSPTPFEIGLLGIGTAFSTVLPEAMLAFSEQAIVLLTPVYQLIVQIDAILVKIYEVTLVELGNATLRTTTIMINAFQSVIPVLEAVNTILQQMISLLNQIASAAQATATALTDGFKAAADAIKDQLIPALEEVRDVLKDLKSMAEAAAGAVNSFGNATPGNVPEAVMGQHGLDFIVPPGYPRDSFPVRVSSGERVVVIPRGQPGNAGGSTVNNSFNMTVNTAASAGTVYNDFETMRALIG